MRSTDVFSPKSPLSLAQYREWWCCYEHHVIGSQPFYRGICRIRDVYTFVDCVRNTAWREYVDTINTQFTVTLLCVSQSDIGCRNWLSHEMNNYIPPCNAKGARMLPLEVICESGPLAGESFKTAKDAAIAVGATPGTMSNHLNRRTGYKHIKGNVFIRGAGGRV